jgi:hypothetical protein
MNLQCSTVSGFDTTSSVHDRTLLDSGLLCHEDTNLTRALLKKGKFCTVSVDIFRFTSVMLAGYSLSNPSTF